MVLLLQKGFSERLGVQSRNRFIFASGGREEKQEGVELCARHLCIRPRARLSLSDLRSRLNRSSGCTSVAEWVPSWLRPAETESSLILVAVTSSLAGLCHISRVDSGDIEAFPLRFHRRGGLEPLEPHVGEEH